MAAAVLAFTRAAALDCDRIDETFELPGTVIEPEEEEEEEALAARSEIIVEAELHILFTLHVWLVEVMLRHVISVRRKLKVTRGHLAMTR